MGRNTAYNQRRNRYYTAGSVAYEVEPQFYPDPQEEQQIIKREQREEHLYKRARFLHRMKLVMAISVVFVCCIGTMISYAMVAEQRITNNRLNDELLALRSENIALEAEIADKINLEYVEQEAMTRLDMSEPQPYQISYIDIPRQSYTVQYDVEEEPEQKGFTLAGLSGLTKED